MGSGGRLGDNRVPGRLIVARRFNAGYACQRSLRDRRYARFC